MMNFPSCSCACAVDIATASASTANRSSWYMVLSAHVARARRSRDEGRRVLGGVAVVDEDGAGEVLTVAARATSTRPIRRADAVADQTARLTCEAASQGAVVPRRRCRPASSRFRHIAGVLLETALTDSGMEDARNRPRSACRSIWSLRSRCRCLCNCLDPLRLERTLV